MKSFVLSVLYTIARPLTGKGILDKYFPWLNRLFQYVYARLQSEPIKSVNLPLGCKLTVYTDDPAVGLPLIVAGSYEPKQTELFLDTVKPGEVFLDIGANVGYFSVLAARKVGESGHIYAFEPDRDNMKLFRENVALNDITYITLEEKALSDQNQTLTFTPDVMNKSQSAIQSRSSSAQRAYEVEAVTIDSYFEQLEQSAWPTIVKMDIEGAEMAALRGGRDVLSSNNTKSFFIEYNPPSLESFGEKPEDLIALLKAYGFVIEYIIDDSRDRIEPFSEEVLRNTLSHITFCNFFCRKA